MKWTVTSKPIATQSTRRREVRSPQGVAPPSDRADARPTIAAIASGASASGVGIIRISGERAFHAGRRLAPDLPQDPEPRRAYLTWFADGAGQALDQGLWLFFKGPHSYTGEDVVELQCHGSPVLLGKLLKEALSIDGVRLAEPGEFTRRAFLNGRLDLSQAEAVGELVSAQSEEAALAAAAQLRGGLSKGLTPLRDSIRSTLADLEGALSFPDEADPPPENLLEIISGLAEQAERLAKAAGRGRLVRRRPKVTLFGPVNAGKSTLFNLLLSEDRALVDEEPGTTRDVLEAELELPGGRITLADTAGLRADPGRVEAMGIARTRAALSSSDLCVLILPPGAPDREVAEWSALVPGALMVVEGKADLAVSNPPPGGRHRLSGKTGEGVEGLKAELSSRLRSGMAEHVLAASERHAQALNRTSEAVKMAAMAARGGAIDAVASQLGVALEALGEITGESVVPAVLDEVFNRFCIGK